MFDGMVYTGESGPQVAALLGMSGFSGTQAGDKL
jgi:hypothetical protein